MFTGHASRVHRSRLTCSQVTPHMFTGHVSRVHRSRLTCLQVTPHVFTGHASRVHRSRLMCSQVTSVKLSKYQHHWISFFPFAGKHWSVVASQTARRVQAVYDSTSLLVRRRTIVPGGPDHAVGRCNCQTWPQICRIQFSCSATNYMVARRPVLRGCWSTCMEQTSTTASLRIFS